MSTPTDSASESEDFDSEFATQQRLQEYVDENREQLTTLTITGEEVLDSSTLDFCAIGVLQNLEELELSGISVASLVFTCANTPNLRRLHLYGVGCPDDEGLRFELELPELRSLDIHHVSMTGKCDFGLSLSRCPKLEQLNTYKCRYLSGMNFCVLPSCKSISLHRSECTNSLEILQAPCLTELSVRAAYSLTNVRLWDIEYMVDVSDVERLTKEFEKVINKMGKEIVEIAEEWKNGSFDGTDAYRNGWIEEDDIDDFDFEDENVQVIFKEDIDEEYEERFKAAKSLMWAKFVEDVSTRNVTHPKELLPDCFVNHLNMNMDHVSKKHLASNRRVTLKGNDDGFNETRLPFELIRVISQI